MAFSSDSLNLLFRVGVDSSGAKVGIDDLKKSIRADAAAIKADLDGLGKGANAGRAARIVTQEQITALKVFEATEKGKITAAQATARAITQAANLQAKQQTQAANNEAKARIQFANNEARLIENEKKREFSEFQRLEREKTKAAQAESRKRSTLDGVLSGAKSFASNVSSAGRSLSIGLTAPLVLAAKELFTLGSSLDASRNKLTAATGSITLANAKLVELRALAKDSAGVFSEFAVDLFSFFKPIEGIGEKTINGLIQAFGRLKLANEELDVKTFGRNLVQIFQNVSNIDIKQARTAFPRFDEIIQKQFGIKEVKDIKELKAAGKLTIDQFLAGFTEGIKNDKSLGLLTDSVGVRFAKSFERIQVALVPIGAVVAASLENIINVIEPVIVRIGDTFTSLSPTVQTVIVAIAGIAAAVGPVLLIFGPVISGIASVIGLLAPVGAAIVSLGGFIAGFIGIIGEAGLVASFSALASVLGGVVTGAISAFLSALAPVAVGVAAFVAVIGVLIAAGATLYAAWQTDFGGIRTFTLEAFSAIQTTITTVLTEVYGFIQTTVSAIVAFWNDNYNTIADITGKVSETIKGTIQTFLKGITGFWQTYGAQITQVVGATWNLVKDIVGGAVQILGATVKTALLLLNGNWKEAWQSALNVVTIAFRNIGNFTKDGVNLVVSIVGTVLTFIKDFSIKLIQAFVVLGVEVVKTLAFYAKEAVTGFVNFFLDLPNRLATIVANIIPLLRKVGGDIGSAIIQGLKDTFSNTPVTIPVVAPQFRDGVPADNLAPSVFVPQTPGAGVPQVDEKIQKKADKDKLDEINSFNEQVTKVRRDASDKAIDDAKREHDLGLIGDKEAYEKQVAAAESNYKTILELSKKSIGAAQVTLAKGTGAIDEEGVKEIINKRNAADALALAELNKTKQDLLDQYNEIVLSRLQERNKKIEDLQAEADQKELIGIDNREAAKTVSFADGEKERQEIADRFTALRKSNLEAELAAATNPAARQKIQDEIDLFNQKQQTSDAEVIVKKQEAVKKDLQVTSEGLDRVFALKEASNKTLAAIDAANVEEGQTTQEDADKRNRQRDNDLLELKITNLKTLLAANIGNAEATIQLEQELSLAREALQQNDNINRANAAKSRKQTLEEERKAAEEVLKIRREVLEVENDILNFRNAQSRKILVNTVDSTQTGTPERFDALLKLRDFDISENERRRNASISEANAEREIELGKIKDKAKEAEAVSAINDLYVDRIKLINEERETASREIIRSSLKDTVDSSFGKDRRAALVALRDFDIAEAERRAAQRQDDLAAELDAAFERVKGTENEEAEKAAIVDAYRTRGLKSEDDFQKELANIRKRYRDAAAADGLEGGFDFGLNAGRIAELQVNADTVTGIFKTIGSVGGAVFGGLADAVGNAVQAFVLYGNAGGSIRKVTAQILAGVAAQSAVLAVFELAKGFAALFFNPPEAAAHFTAAALYGSIAGIAAIAGRITAGDSFKKESSGAFGSSTPNNSNSGDSQRSGNGGTQFSSFGDETKVIENGRNQPAQRQDIYLHLRSNDSHIVEVVKDGVNNNSSLRTLIVDTANS